MGHTIRNFPFLYLKTSACVNGLKYKKIFTDFVRKTNEMLSKIICFNSETLDEQYKLFYKILPLIYAYIQC